MNISMKMLQKADSKGYWPFEALYLMLLITVQEFPEYVIEDSSILVISNFNC